jgi:hypothetical protein
MGRSITCGELLAAAEPGESDELSGKELAKLFWTIRQREKDLERRERYWASINDGLASAYDELERKTRELDILKEELLRLNVGLEKRVSDQVGEIVAHLSEVESLNVQLQARVRERSRELMLALRHAGMKHETSFFAPGTVIGQRARILRRLGEGGMGTVYAAEDLLTSRHVAVKILRSAGARALQYFVAEAEAASAASHPAIVRTLHVDVTEEGHVFQLMELVDGVTLARRMSVSRLPYGETARIGAAIASALAAAHERGVIHRDIKPDNVLLSADEPGVRILDFGVAKRLAAAEPQTIAGALLGTPLYMSPDQIRSPSTVTAAADVYSLGVVLFEALAGRRPFDVIETEALLFAHLNQPVPQVLEHAPGIAPALAALVEACLSKQPSTRPTACAAAQMLASLADDLSASCGRDIGRQAKALVAAVDQTACEP